MKSWLVIVVWLALLVACATQIRTPDYFQYLKPCPVAELRERTTAEAIRVASARREALIQCNKDKAKLRELLTH